MPSSAAGMAKLVRAERRRRGWTQTELAKAAGVSLNTLSNFENGKSDLHGPNLRAIRRLLDMGDNPEPEPDDSHVAEATRAKWDPDVQAYLDIIWCLPQGAAQGGTRRGDARVGRRPLPD